ncbi:MAG: GNAT family N-acetyltransferase [Paucibacter sp.]|nr:GNAT family N-acetyltransferase [Roseateles sp.]
MNTPALIEPARIPEELDLVRTLFREYALGTGLDLAFQGFEQELAALPGKYAVPRGRILLAWRAGEALGCVALRPIAGGAGGDCEMKRLYVRPQARGLQLGRLLAKRICQEGREAGYSRILLDTLASMTPALTLYRSLGFEDVPAYVYNPLPDVVYLGRELRDF